MRKPNRHKNIKENLTNYGCGYASKPQEANEREQKIGNIPGLLPGSNQNIKHGG